MKQVTVWHVLAVSILLVILLISSGKWTGAHMVVAIFGLILLGAIFPPLALGIGLIAILRLLLTNPNLVANPLTGFLNNLSSAVGEQLPSSSLPQGSTSSASTPKVAGVNSIGGINPNV